MLRSVISFLRECILKIGPWSRQAYGAAQLKKTDFESRLSALFFRTERLKTSDSVGPSHPERSRGDVVEFVGAAIDVTERKQAEEERQAHLFVPGEHG